MVETKINHAAVILPVTKEGRIFLIRKDLSYLWNPGMWGFFGGRIEYDEREDGADTLVRELAEEIGLMLPDIKFFKEHSYYDIAPSTGRRREGKLQAYTSSFDGDLSKIKLREGAGMSLWEEKEIWNLHMVPHNKDLVMELYRTRANDNKV